MAVCIVALLGCSSKRPKVFVDEAKLGLTTIEASERSTILSSNMPQSTDIKTDSARFEIANSQGSGRVSGSASIDRSAERRLQTIEKLRISRLEQLDNLLNLREQGSRTKLEQKRDEILRQAIEKTRYPFEQYSGELGRLYLERSNIQASYIWLGEIAPDHPKKIEQEMRTKVIDQRIEDLNAAYIVQRDSIFAGFANDQANRERAITVETETERAKETKRILSDLQELTRSSSPLERSLRQNIGAFTLENFEWSQKPITLRSKRLDLDIKPNSPPTKNAKLLRSDIARWASLSGYEIVTSPNKGRNATEEFLLWRKSRHLGP